MFASKWQISLFTANSDSRRANVDGDFGKKVKFFSGEYRTQETEYRRWKSYVSAGTGVTNKTADIGASGYQDAGYQGNRASRGGNIQSLDAPFGYTQGSG